jgi:hypothetical protein
MTHTQSLTNIVNEINYGPKSDSVLEEYETDNSKLVHKFNEYLSDIRIEVEILKVRTSQRNNEGVQERISRIDRAISGITDIILEYVEKSGKREIIIS